MDTTQILIVDDAQSVLELCADTLRFEGYQVLTASGGQEALYLLKTERIDLLLVDLVMPDLSGLEVLKHARKLDPNLAVVVITGFGTVRNAIEALRAGVRGFLLKPFDPDELLQAVEDALEVCRQERETLFLRAWVPLLEITQRQMAQGDVASIPRRLLRAGVEQVGADGACLMLLAEETNELYIAEAIGLPRDAIGALRISADLDIAREVLEQADPLLLKGRDLPESVGQALPIVVSATLACVRLHTRDATIGLICLGRSSPEGAFSPSDLYLLSAIGGQIAIALENTRLYEAIHQSEERFKQFFENEPEYCYMVSPDGTILDVNRAAIEALGYTRKELIGQPMSTVYAPDSLPDAERLFGKWMKIGGLKNEELLVATKDGEIRTVLLSASVVRDRDGKTLHSVLVQRDITERKQSEQELCRQNEYLASLHEIGLGLITRRELTELLGAIAERVGALLGTPHSFIYLLAPDGKAMELRIGTGVYAQQVGYRLKLDEGLAGKVWRSGQSLVVDHYGAWPDRMRDARFNMLHAVAAVPLFSSSQVIGVLGLAHVVQDTEFRFEEIALLSQFAELASIALDNARLFDQAQQEIMDRTQAEQTLEHRAAQLALLSEIGSQIAAVLELDSVLKRTATLVQESFGYHHVALFTLDPEQGELRMRAKAGLFIDLFPPGHHLALDQGMVGWVGRHGETVWANDVDAEPRYVNLYPDVIPSRSELSVPVQIGGEILGVLDVQSPELDAFDENDVLVMETLADQISVAIDNARLYEQAQKEIVERRQAQAALRLQRDLAITLSSTQDLMETLHQVLDGFCRIEAIDCGGVYLVDENTKEVNLVAHKGLSPEFVEAVSCYPAGSPQAQLVMAGHPVHIHYSELLTEARDRVRTREELCAIAVIPVLYQGQVIAALNLASHTQDVLADNTRNVLEVTASQIGGVIARVMAEDALRESEQRIRGLVEHSSDAIVLTDEQGHVVSWNQGAVQLSGVEAAAALGRPLWDVQFQTLPDERKTPAIYEQLQNSLLEAFETGQAPWLGQLMEMEIQRLDGARRTTQTVGFTVETEQGFRFGSVIRDITERKQAAEALRFTQFAIDRASDPAYWMGSDARFIYVNNAACRNLGYSRDELLTMTVHDIDPDLPAEVWPNHWREVKEKGSFTIESHHQARDGRVFPVEVTVNFLEFEGREYNIAFARDITERKQAEEALRESESRYRTLFESADDAIFIHDLTGQFLAVNHLACKRLGYHQKELLQMTRMNIKVPEHAVLVPERIEEVRRYGQGLFETVHMRQDGTTIPIELSCRLIEYEGTPAILCIARDLTARKRMEQYLLRTERLAAMGHLAAALAHEINNPLQSIGSSMELVLDYPLEDNEQQEYLEAVRQEIERLMALTTRVLDFARPPRVERYLVSIVEVVQHALSLAGKQLMHSCIGIQADIPDDLPAVQASRDQLTQVFLNLILNAIEAMPDGGRLSISARCTDGQIALDFQDTGAGLQADVVDKVFEPFYTTKEEGTGLGLAISYSIIQQHGGTITADSAPGGGAMFTIILPVAAAGGF